MADSVYVVREKANFKLMTDTEIKQHKKKQKQEINKKHYHKRREIEQYYKETYNDVCDVLRNCDDICSETDRDLFLKCKKICEEELGISSVWGFCVNACADAHVPEP